MSSNMVLKSNSEQTSVISWNDRFHQAMDRYDPIEGTPPILIPALIEGFRIWADFLPYSFQNDKGCYLPVNTRGLGAEYTEIYAVVDWLTLKSQRYFNATCSN